jgi:hypothetical protein
MLKSLHEGLSIEAAPRISCVEHEAPFAQASPRRRLEVIAVGDVLTLHDADTGASTKNVSRPCLVIAIGPTIVVVAPRSVSVSGKVPTPATSSAGFDKPGSFSRWRCRVGRPAAEAATNHGQLAEPYRSQVLALSARGST